MLSPTPAVRAAIFGLCLATAVAVTGAALHLGAAERAAQRHATDTLGAQAIVAASALTDPAPAGVRRQLGALALAPGTEAMVYDRAGRLVAATDPEVARAADWPRTLAALPPDAPVATADGQRYAVAGVPAAGGGRVVAVRPLPGGPPEGALLETVVAAVSLWGLLVGVLVVVAWYTGPRTATQLTLLGERIAQGDADGEALIRHAGLWLGPLAGAFGPVVARLRALGARGEDVRQHLAALYQINPHYVVLCSQDGEVVEANPAFYAATGLPPDAVRGGRVGVLRETFPVEPLMELAARSLREGSAISGIEYAVIDRDDHTRPVEVSLRGFTLEGRPMVLFQATDQAHQKQLERRVAAFTDTLDLMVDQRVHQLAAGQQTLNRILDAAGVVIASFDAGGGTSRWSGAAQVLTGRSIGQAGHFAAVTSAMGLSPAERTAFTQWFWGPADGPFVGQHGVAGPGGPRVRQIIWQRVDAGLAGRSDLRTLVGVDVPAYVDLGAVSGPSGDGQGGAEPVQSAPESETPPGSGDPSGSGE